MPKKPINFSYQFRTAYVEGEPITFKTIKIDGNSTYFKLDENKEIVLYYGKNNTEEWINYVIEKSLPSYYKNSLKYKRHEINAICNDYLTIFTKKYLIKIIKSTSRNYYELLNDTIYMHLTKPENQKVVVKKVYEDLVKPAIIKRTNYWAKKMNAVVKSIKFKSMNWAFAYYRYSDNSITFSLRSACCSPDAFDYLIIHELSHYFYHNHKKEFWKKVEEFCPNYKELDRKLKLYQ